MVPLARRPARCSARRDPGLWQRRLHFVHGYDARDQFRGWAARRLRHGQDEDRPRPATRIRSCRRRARDAIGADVELFVDANGAYRRREAVAASDSLGAFGVTWFEEPVSSNDRDGLRFVRQHVPSGDGRRRGRVRLDAHGLSRPACCGRQWMSSRSMRRAACGITGFVNAAAMAEAHELPALSALRSGAPREPRMRGPQRTPHRMVPRPRPARARVLRWLSQCCRRAAWRRIATHRGSASRSSGRT